MAGRRCSICCDARKFEQANKLIAEGATDQAIADALGVGRMSVQRHRINHVLEPARVIAAAANQGREAAEQRRQILAAAEAGELDATAAYLALAPITASLRIVDARVERSSAAAEQAGQHTATAALSGQAIRVIETRAKLGGHGGFRNQATDVGDSGGKPRFSVQILFSGAPPETISVMNDRPELEGHAEASDEPGG